MKLGFQGLKLEFLRRESKYFLTAKKYERCKLWFLRKREGKETVTAKVLSPCCHTLLSHHNIFVIRHLNTNRWQMTANFHSFPYRFDSFHHRGHGGHRGYNYLWIRTLKPLRPPCPLWWNSSFLHRNKSIFKDVIVLNQIPQFSDCASKLSHT